MMRASMLVLLHAWETICVDAVRYGLCLIEAVVTEHHGILSGSLALYCCSP